MKIFILLFVLIMDIAHALKKFGVIVVDHGSRVSSANDNLNKLVTKYKLATTHAIVEAAHMEMAEPTIAQAFEKCVEQGAEHIICHPYFLSSGRHVLEDIPAQLNAAALKYPHIPFSLTPPLGADEAVVQLIDSAVQMEVKRLSDSAEL